MADKWVDDAEPEAHSYDYDLIVIGGGSGGLAASKEAATLGKKVAVFDFVTPTPIGTKWGLGGTCVNVGCIPKKLMHTAALHGEALKDAEAYGWEVGTPKHNWEKLVQEVQDHIGSLNWGYRVSLREKSVTYENARAVFKDAHTVEATNAKKVVKTHTARRFIIATGGRPRYPDIPGAREYGITSDDIFSLEKPPGETLVVGASYVALECAGFLQGLGYRTTVMVRSILLRGFDQQMAEMIGDYMQGHGVQFIRESVPTCLNKLDSGRIRVDYKGAGGEASLEVDTVLFAIGRDPETGRIGLDQAGVTTAPDGKLIVTNERTNVPHIYAIGDIVKGTPELTPVAIAAGRLLAQRLYKGSTTPMDYKTVCTTVFTPLEYGCCGYSEEEARQVFPDVEVYHTFFKPLEWTVAHREDNACYTKVIVNKADSERVVGFHILGPNAGEITQGFGTAMKCGMTMAQLSSTIGIHPTCAEEVTDLVVTKSSGEAAQKKGC